jgi:dynein heavy chain
MVEEVWLKINTNPIKQSLSTWVRKWIHTYTSYLFNDVTRKLTQLETLMQTAHVGLQQEVPRGDGDALKKVLGFIHQIRSRKNSTIKMFQPLRDTVSLLKKYGRNLDEYELKLLSDAPMKWDATVNMVYKVRVVHMSHAITCCFCCCFHSSTNWSFGATLL